MLSADWNTSVHAGLWFVGKLAQNWRTTPSTACGIEERGHGASFSPDQLRKPVG
jgi:hypothetical protein